MRWGSLRKIPCHASGQLERVEVARLHVFTPADGVDEKAGTECGPVSLGETVPVEQRESDSAHVEPEVDQVDDAAKIDFSLCRKTPVGFMVFGQTHDGEGDSCQKTNSDVKGPPMRFLAVGIDLDECCEHQRHANCVAVFLAVKVLPVEEWLAGSGDQRSSGWEIAELLSQQH